VASMSADELYEQLQSKLCRQFTEEECKTAERAFLFAKEAHGEQKRESGEPYITHPLSVAIILSDMGLDLPTICAALLHDVIEDTEITETQVRKAFGSEVFRLVDGVTKLGKIPYSTREEQQSENIRKMLLAMAADIRVILIKLADRLHNMRTIENRSPIKRLNTAHETMEIYAPIAHRLGVRMIKEELEDLCLRQLDPIAYKEIEESLAIRRDEREAFLNSIKNRLGERLTEMGLKTHIDGRVKSVYGIYRKMYIGGREFDEIYDIYAVRIIVDTVPECYNILGVIHDIMHPIPGRFKDYISTPKPNMYQSLHTTVIGKEGVPFEVQIRTWEMHYTAEYGIAAHWKYKVGVTGKDSMDNRLAWIHQLLDFQQESDDAEDFVKSLRTDLSIDEVFVFTPGGDVINLPSDATPIDFAYAIHTQVGHRMIGAKADGRIVNIDRKLNNGEIVEILLSPDKNHGPSREWLQICKTNEARTKIRQWFKKERRTENIATGRQELERELKHNGIDLQGEEYDRFIEEIAQKQKCASAEDFYATIGYGGITLSKIIGRIRDEYRKKMSSADESIQIEQVKKLPKSNGGVVVEGVEDCLVHFAQCCNPLPGDDIVGFITRGSGVSIHKGDCPNAVKMISTAAENGRWVKAEWATALQGMFKASMHISCDNRDGILADVALMLSSMHVSISSVTAREGHNGESFIEITVVITSLRHLTQIMEKLKTIAGIKSITRSMGS